MILRRAVVATIVLLLGPASAFAQAAVPPVPVPIRIVEHSAKFLCGVVDERAPTAAPVRPGTYETSINIHNPELPGTPDVFFLKKVVLAPREGDRPIPPSKFHPEKLPTDFAMRVDCKVIRAILGPPHDTDPFIEGFVVLFVFPNPATVPHEFDVVGVYTVDTPQQSISLEMMQIPARTLTVGGGAAGRRLRDLLLEQPKPN
jgi:hypothetical protein